MPYSRVVRQFLRLLGPPVMEVAGSSISLDSQRPTLILLYLAYKRRWVSRSELVALMWPDTDAVKARHALRSSLYRAKRLPWAQGLEIEIDRVRWLVDTDVAAFMRSVDERGLEGAGGQPIAPLLDAIDATGIGPYEDWLTEEREAVFRSWSRAALQHAAASSAAGRHSDAADQYLAVLAHDPLAEDVLLGYLTAAQQAGRRTQPLQEYQRFTRRLFDEMGLEPLAETRSLADLLREGAGRAVDESPAPIDLRRLQLTRPTHFVGRAAEMRAIESAITPLVVVRGDAGIGKTRLVEETAPSATRLQAREGHVGHPFHLLMPGGLRTVAPHSSALSLVERLIRPGASTALDEVDPATARQRLIDSLVDALSHLDGLMVVEDLQWADAGTLEVLTALALRGRVRVVATCRTGEESDELRRFFDHWRAHRLMTEIHIGPLTRATTAELASGLTAGSDVPPELGDWLFERSAGNPLFVLQNLALVFGSLEATVDGSAVWASLDAQTLRDQPVPDVVSHVISRRTTLLTERTRRVLQATSVLGTVVSVATVARLAGLSHEATLTALDEAEAHGFIHGHEFGHDLLRRSVYESLTTIRRQHLHRRCTELLGAGADDTVIADHLARGGEAAAAFEKYANAAEKLRDRGLFTEAMTVASTALALGTEHPRTGPLLLLVLTCQRDLNQLDDARETIRALERTPVEPDTRVTGLGAAFSVHWILGERTQAAACLSAAEGVQLRASLNRSSARDIQMMRAVVATADERFGDAVQIYKALVEADADHQPSFTERVDLLLHLAANWQNLGRFDDALATLDDALVLATSRSATHVMVNATALRFEVLFRAGRPSEGVADAEAALALGDFWASEHLRSNLAYAYYTLGDVDRSFGHFETLATGARSALYRSNALAYLATIHALRGSLAAARRAVTAGLAELPNIDVLQVRNRVLAAAVRFGSDQQASHAATELRSHPQADLAPEVLTALAHWVERADSRDLSSAENL
ncbi:MAG TPA: AAA family ATPase [Trueperaceae bacterium]|nr:AAA family ATPase [Trueperaceae bacterium]